MHRETTQTVRDCLVYPCSKAPLALCRFEQFATDIDLDDIKRCTSILPDIVDSVHAYWILKREVDSTFHLTSDTITVVFEGSTWPTIDRYSR